MYRVLVVDDEPVSAQYVKKVIEIKCPEFEIAAVKGSGEEAIHVMEEESIDVLVTDIMMPNMNGLELVTYVSQHMDHVISVIISGYQDFEFAQSAIRVGVSDYLLKPINPTEMQKLFEKLKQRLDWDYYTRRNKLLHYLSADAMPRVDSKLLRRVFTEKQYYAAIIRKGGLISRFVSRLKQEIYSMKDEQMIIYGRDEMEMLYVYPEKLVVLDFTAMMNHNFYKQSSDETYLTMVVRKDPFEIDELPQVMRELYHTLDQSIVIGKEQKIELGEEKNSRKDLHSEKKFEDLMYFVRCRDMERTGETLKETLDLWEKEERPQFYVEEKVRYLFYEMINHGILEKYDEHLFDDLFADVISMKELKDSILEFIDQNKVVKNSGRGAVRQEVFEQITEYMKHHPPENLSIQNVCRQFGISQTTLSRLFRNYANMSYNNYLIRMRVEMAQKMLREQKDSYIKDVATAVGYSDQFYFSRIFRSVTGMSPSEYVEKYEMMKGREKG